MKITINVTKKDIENGTRDCSISCPVALASSRKIIGRKLYVSSHNITSFKRDCISKIFIGILPSTAREFIHALDTFGKDNLSPFRFSIDIPARFVRRK